MQTLIKVESYYHDEINTVDCINMLWIDIQVSHLFQQKLCAIYPICSCKQRESICTVKGTDCDCEVSTTESH